MNDRNNILWTYGGLSGIDEPHTAILAWPISCVMKGTTGFTLWNTTGFGENFMETPIDNGEQTIMYPGEKFGFDAPIASIRFKVMRNCMQIADRIMGFEKDGRKKTLLKFLIDTLNLQLILGGTKSLLLLIHLRAHGKMSSYQ